jgi:hypothetical protein
MEPEVEDNKLEQEHRSARSTTAWNSRFQFHASTLPNFSLSLPNCVDQRSVLTVLRSGVIVRTQALRS